jgi:hypothetical protein
MNTQLIEYSRAASTGSISSFGRDLATCGVTPRPALGPREGGAYEQACSEGRTRSANPSVQLFKTYQRLVWSATCGGGWVRRRKHAVHLNELAQLAGLPSRRPA